MAGCQAGGESRGNITVVGRAGASFFRNWYTDPDVIGPWACRCATRILETLFRDRLDHGCCQLDDGRGMQRGGRSRDESRRFAGQSCGFCRSPGIPSDWHPDCDAAQTNRTRANQVCRECPAESISGIGSHRQPPATKDPSHECSAEDQEIRPRTDLAANRRLPQEHGRATPLLPLLSRTVTVEPLGESRCTPSDV